jgi:hypothetical protein
MLVPTLDPTSETFIQLRRVAVLLTRVGHASPATTDPGVALLCLAAAEDLRQLGVTPPRLAIGTTQIAAAVSEALASLAALPDDIFAATPVLDAAANVRAARAQLANSR